jgi:hypothetical protein
MWPVEGTGASSEENSSDCLVSILGTSLERKV